MKRKQQIKWLNIQLADLARGNLVYFLKYRVYVSVWEFNAGHGSRAWTVFARSDAVIVGSNPTRGMDVYMFVRFSVFVLSCV
jgi:hypothetical protein